MEYVIRFGDSPPHVEVVTSGLADAAGFRAFLETVFRDPRYRPGMTILLDHSALDMSRASADEARAITDFLSIHNAELGSGPCAAVQPTMVGYGLARMRGLYHDDWVSLDWTVFHQRDEAVAWLVAQAAGQPTE